VLVHDRYGLVLAVVGAVGAIGAVVSLVRPQLFPLVRLYLRVVVVLVAAQVVVGLTLVATGERPRQFIHWIYGAAMLLALPVAMAVGKRLPGREQHIWVAGGAALTVLFALRAVATG